MHANQCTRQRDVQCVQSMCSSTKTDQSSIYIMASIYMQVYVQLVRCAVYIYIYIYIISYFVATSIYESFIY
jgi:hypothetical protein